MMIFFKWTSQLSVQSLLPFRLLLEWVAHHCSRVPLLPSHFNLLAGPGRLPFATAFIGSQHAAFSWQIMAFRGRWLPILRPQLPACSSTFSSTSSPLWQYNTFISLVPQDRDDGRLSGFLVAWHSFHLTSRVYVYFCARRASLWASQAWHGSQKGASSPPSPLK